MYHGPHPYPGRHCIGLRRHALGTDFELGGPRAQRSSEGCVAVQRLSHSLAGVVRESAWRAWARAGGGPTGPTGGRDCILKGSLTSSSPAELLEHRCPQLWSDRRGQVAASQSCAGGCSDPPAGASVVGTLARFINWLAATCLAETSGALLSPEPGRSHASAKPGGI